MPETTNTPATAPMTSERRPGGLTIRAIEPVDYAPICDMVTILFGAFVAGSETLVETLIQEARTYIYTTAPPPAVVMATRATRP